MPENQGWARPVLIFKTWVLEIIGLNPVSGDELEMII